MRKLKENLAFTLSFKDKPRLTDKRESALVSDLRAAGLDVFTVQQLRSTSDSYPEAIPVLIKYLRSDIDKDILGTIARALMVAEAKGIAFANIYEIYRSLDDQSEFGVKSDFAAALSYLAEKKDLQKIIDLALDKKNGPTRIYFVDKIAKMANLDNKEYIKSVLTELSKDTENYIDVRAKKALALKKFN